MKTYRLYVLPAMVCLSGAAIACLLYFGQAPVTDPVSDAGSSTTSSSPPPTSSPSVCYTLGSWNGRLALYQPNNPYPQEVYDVFIRAFPPEEREKLEQGIAVFSEAELEQLLEDYTS